jgi:hypothetical protein
LVVALRGGGPGGVAGPLVLRGGVLAASDGGYPPRLGLSALLFDSADP